MGIKLIGRDKEVDILHKSLEDAYSSFIAVYGRRRIGKTFLIRESFGYRFTFQHSGISNGSFKEQLFAFSSSLKDAGYTFSKKPENWLEAFEYLKDVIRNSTEKKKIIFIDELSWMDTPRSDLMKGLENFWNGFAAARKDVVLIVCASATSWMLSKVVHNKGGLHNRLTNRINLLPFSLKECELYVKEKGIVFTREQILQYYMIFGGIPFYWECLERGMSLAQNVDNILFAKDAPLKEEFKYLYASVFKKPEQYIKIIEALGNKKMGLTRDEIIKYAKLTNSGDVTLKLNELESCGFIRSYCAYGNKKKNTIYQLIDNFTLFYFHFLKDKNVDEHFWSAQTNTPSINAWLGLAFERVCLLHIDQMKQKLGIAGVLTTVNSWYCKENADKGTRGSQIDLLIVRNDHVINMCEMKYSSSEYILDKKTHQTIRNKIEDLKRGTKTKYAIYPTLVTTYGLVENAYAGDIQSVVTMDDLFV